MTAQDVAIARYWALIDRPYSANPLCALVQDFHRTDPANFDAGL
jgi:hypothetical protein